jgi:DNA-binding protein H-NS
MKPGPKLTAIRKKISALKKLEDQLLNSRAALLNRIVKQLAAKGVTVAELSAHAKLTGEGARERGKAKAKRKKTKATDGRGKVQLKYRDNAGNTWTGRGKAPRWLVDFEAQGGKRETLAV